MAVRVLYIVFAGCRLTLQGVDGDEWGKQGVAGRDRARQVAASCGSRSACVDPLVSRLRFDSVSIGMHFAPIDVLTRRQERIDQQTVRAHPQYTLFSAVDTASTAANMHCI